MNILVACEESQRVCTEFRKRGHRAFSCDIIEPSGGHPEWHIQADVLPLLNGDCKFTTLDGKEHKQDGKWDMLIAFPPCTYLSNAATRSHSLKRTPLQKINDRTLLRVKAMQFFMDFANADCDKIAIENPIGVMNTCYRKPDQIIHPYMFADSENDREQYVTKATCLWLKQLPPLVGKGWQKPDNKKIFGVYSSGKAKTWEDCFSRDANVRSKTFHGVAKAMAKQWG